MIENIVSQKDKAKLQEELFYLIKTKPNRPLIKIPWVTTKKRSSLNIIKAQLWFYNKFNKQKENRLNWFFKNKIGEAPVLLDTFECQIIAKNMENYLFNKGFFKNQVSYEIFTYNKKAVITYKANGNYRWIIDTILYPEVVDRVTSLVKQSQNLSLLKTGTFFDANMMQAERERITDIFKNAGYLKFIKDLIYFDADSTARNGKVKLYYKIQTPKDSSMLKPFSINKVFVFTDFNYATASDTSIIYDTIVYNNHHYLFNDFNFRPKSLDDKIFINAGEYYNQSNMELTIKRLSELPIVKSVDVKYFETKDSLSNKVDCIILIKNSEKKEYQIEGEGITNDFNNQDNNIGTSANIGFKHKNLFKGGEVFSIKQRVGLAWQIFNKQSNLNTFELNTQVDLTFPKFALPIDIRSKKINNPKTQLAIKNNYQFRFDNFKLNTTNILFSYSWNENKYKIHTLTPLTFNFFQLLETSPAFKQRLESASSLQQSFQEQFIVGSAWKYLFDQGLIGKKNPLYFATSIELAGNSLRALASVAKFNYDEVNKQYQLFDRPFSQYVRFDFDTRKYYGINNRSSFVMRLAGGIGVPLSNSNQVLPFIKQFYIGGNNSLRAFPIRRLGPGSYISNQVVNSNGEYIYVDQNGDMKLEANAEVRFNIFKWFKGAVFLDAGNIWLLNKDATKQGANFELNRFYKEIAIGTGAGLRMDFSYFLMRFDLGVPIRKPYLPENDRWLFDKIAIQSKNWRRSNFILNLAIGYPF